MICGISGEAPQEPVVSKKSGIIYEKRLVEQYIKQNGTEPGTGQALVADDLLPVQSSSVVYPRPPALTSIPALLATFQNEWDTLALETFNLREQLARTREELATALYQNDAAVRVVARLTRERDEARQSLSNVTVKGGAPDGDRMAIDTVETLPVELAERVDEMQQSLTKGRKKRPLPEGWVTGNEIESFERETSSDLPLSQVTSLVVEGDFAAVGGLSGEAALYSMPAGALERQMAIAQPVTDTLWVETRLMFATSQGTIKVYKGSEEAASVTKHDGPATALCCHPGGEILASVGADKRIVFYELSTMKAVSSAYTDAGLTKCAFHPDGHLFAAGTTSGEVKLFMTKSLEQAAVFSLEAPIEAIAFSENGFWFAAAAKGLTSVTIFDLRKEGSAAIAKVLEVGGAVRSLAWDYTGQFLATAGPSGLTVQQYAKSAKKWKEVLRNAVPAVAVRWGAMGKKLVAVDGDGVVSVYGGSKG